MVFRGEMGEVGQIASKLRDVPYVGHVLFPFLRTIYHISRRGLERTPLGFVQLGFETTKGTYGSFTNVLRGKVRGPGEGLSELHAPIGERVGDAVLGTLLAVVGIHKAAEGMLSAAGPDSPEERAQLKRLENWQPYSIRIGDAWVSYANWGPFATPLALAGSIGEILRYGPEIAKKKHWDIDTLEAKAALTGDAIRSFLELTTNQTYFQGLSTVWTAFMVGSERSFERLVADTLASLVPYGQALNTMGQVVDPYARQPAGEGIVENIVQRLFARSPVMELRSQVPPAQDVFGRPQPATFSGPGAIAPFRVKLLPNQPDRLEAELKRIGYAPAEIDRDLGETRLTSAQLVEYRHKAGIAAYTSALWVMDHPYYQQASDPERKSILKSTIAAARRVVGQDVIPFEERTYEPTGAPPKYLGVSSPAQEARIDAAKSKVNNWVANPMLPMPSNEEFLLAYSHVSAPEHSMWRRQRAEFARQVPEALPNIDLGTGITPEQPTGRGP